MDVLEGANAVAKACCNARLADGDAKKGGYV